MIFSPQKLFLILFLSIFLIFPLFSFAQTPNLQALVAELQKQVLELQKQIQDLKAELGQQIPQTSVFTESQTTESTQESVPEFTKTLSRGSSGDDVRKLQEFLKKDKEIYPDGLVTGYFGPLTEIALKKWQTKHSIEAVGILGPQTRTRFNELGKGVIQGLLQHGAGASGTIPPGLITAPGIQKKLEIATTTPPSKATTTVEDLCPKDPTKCYTEKTCKAQNFYWYTVSCHKEPPRYGTCAESNIYCINSDECSKGGYYWCRNSCYATSTACLGQTYTPPVQPVVPATPAIPATPAQPTSQTSIATVPATPVTPAVPAIVATTTTTGGDTTPPSTPTGLTATSYSSYGITLNWNKSTDNIGVTGYKLYRNGTQIFSEATSTSISIIYFTDGVGFGLTPSTSYSYTVAAHDAAGNVSAQSSAVSTTTLSPADSTPPLISNVQATNITENSTTIIWTTDESASSEIHYALSSITIATSTIKVIDANNVISHSVSLIGLFSGKTYYYVVVSKDAAGNTATSSEQSFVTLTPPLPATPTTINGEGTKKWSLKLESFAIEAAVGSDGTIYVSSQDNGKLLAVNPDGTQKWISDTGPNNYFLNVPSVHSDGTIYFTTPYFRLYAINPDGIQKWSYYFGNNPSPKIAIASDGTIYAGAFDKKLHAIRSDGTQKWTFTTNGNIYSAPAIAADGTIYIGSSDGKLYAINSDGTLKWIFTTGATIFSSAAIGSDGTIYIGSSDRKLYAINSDGTLKWSFAMEDGVGSPVIDKNGIIYVTALRLYAINPDGTKKWSSIEDYYVTPTIGADGVLYLGGVTLTALNSDGSKRWGFYSGSSNYGSLPIASDGTVYKVGHEVGVPYLYAIRSSSLGLNNAPWPKLQKNNRNTSNASDSIALKNQIQNFASVIHSLQKLIEDLQKLFR